jgi:hypothetical protein
VYDPQKLGSDHAAFRIISNAQNFPTLVLPFCGRAVAEFEPGMDSGPMGMDGGTTNGEPPNWLCQGVGETVASCHQ